MTVGALEGRVALVTGSGQGIGQAIAVLFARHGATVVFSDVVAARAQAAAAAAAAAAAGAGKAEALSLDVGDAGSVAAAFATIRERHGRLDILVNNAGIGINAAFIDFRLEDFERCLKVNLTGAFLCGQAAARQMLAQRVGPDAPRSKIINIVSVSGQRGGMGRAGYGASKAGLDLLTRVMATELAGRGINVNAIAPGPVATELAAAVHAAGGRGTPTSSSRRSTGTARFRRSRRRRCSWRRRRATTSTGTRSTWTGGSARPG